MSKVSNYLTVATISLCGGLSGQQAYETLAFHFKKLYSVQKERRNVSAELAIRPDNGGNKDRKITANICNIAGMNPRTGKPGDRGQKRQSPDNGRGENGKSRRSPPRDH